MKYTNGWAENEYADGVTAGLAGSPASHSNQYYQKGWKRGRARREQKLQEKPIKKKEQIQQMDEIRSTKELKQWFLEHVEQMVDNFAEEKSNVYTDSWREFGPRGIVPQLSRKWRRIKAELWDGVKVAHTNEPIEQVVDETIHYLLIMRWMLQNDPEDVDGRRYNERK